MRRRKSRLGTRSEVKYVNEYCTLKKVAENLDEQKVALDLLAANLRQRSRVGPLKRQDRSRLHKLASDLIQATVEKIPVGDLKIE